MSIFAPAIINLWKTIESYGIDPAPLFEAENVKIQLPPDPCQRISYDKLDRIRARAVKECGDQTFGLRQAKFYAPSQFGALGYAMLVSTTLRSACLRLERYVRVANLGAEVKVEDQGDCMVITHKLNIPSETEYVRADGAMALITRMCRMTYGDDFRLNAVNFKHAQPEDTKPYFEYFGCDLHFDQAEDQLLIPIELADSTLDSANPQLALLHDNVLLSRLAKIDQNDIVARVRAVFIQQLPLGSVSDDSVAAALNMSVRTLHRRLSDADNNFRSVLVETRRELAEGYIMDNSLTLTEISLLLGFSEQSSFTRAFKTWTGSTPSETRQARE